ncbi:MAG TPA: DUF5985 family protein [Bryobacteraceae bacterium]|jgi:uncharacterized membrane protein HdeD (DUF308 family)|nr:DUF5985 family protein [Bryobacteraceae bacterium]
MIDGFLLGLIAMASIIAGIFFLKFWRDTRDSFFLSFGASFVIEGLNRSAVLFTDKPNEGSPWTYLIRLLSFLLILIAILRKNYSNN